MYQLDFVCIDHADEQMLDAQLRKMITAHMVAGDFKFAEGISHLATALFRFNLPSTESAINLSRAINLSLTTEQKEMLGDYCESPVDRAMLNQIMGSIIHQLIRHDVATWRLAIYRLEQVTNLTHTLDEVNKILGDVLFDKSKLEEFRNIIYARKVQIEQFIEDDEKQKKS